MRFGACASYEEVAGLEPMPLDFLEESVQRFLAPERPRDEYLLRLRAARSLSIPIEAANVLFPRDLLLIAGPTQRIDSARIERYIRTALERAALAGIKVLVFGSGVARACPADVDPAEALRQLGAHLARWGEWARGHDVRLALEPLRYEETNLVHTIAEGAALVTRLSVPGVRLLADLYHMACNGEVPADLVRAAPLLAHVHVAERRERAAPRTNGDDLRPFLAALQQGGYDRRLSIECRWRDFAAEIGPAIAALRDQWQSAGSAP